MARTVTCISIRQPWAFAIARLGKHIENRDWNTSYRGRIYIHAATVHPLPEQLQEFRRRFGIKIEFKELEYGALIAYGELFNVVVKSRSRWFDGPYGFILHDVKELKQPIPARGWPGIFKATI